MRVLLPFPPRSTSAHLDGLDGRASRKAGDHERQGLGLPPSACDPQPEHALLVRSHPNEPSRWPEVEERAAAAGYRLARRTLRGQLVWWWQLTADRDDTRQPCWLERREALLYMDLMLHRLSIVR
jgi:hypothetical protein